MELKPSGKLFERINSCQEDSLPLKQTHLIALAAQLVRHDQEGAAESMERARGAGASIDEVYCAACAAACVGGDRVGRVFSNLAGGTCRDPFRRVTVQALDRKTSHLVNLAACLVAGCDCSAGHIVEARSAEVKDEELARVACIASCVAGQACQWNFGKALECAQGHKACAC